MALVPERFTWGVDVTGGLDGEPVGQRNAIRPISAGESVVEAGGTGERNATHHGLLRTDLEYAEAHRLLHALWTNAVGTDGYDKKAWIELEEKLRAMARRGI